MAQDKTEQIQSLNGLIPSQMKSEEIFNELFNTFLGEESIVSFNNIPDIFIFLTFSL